MGKNLRQLKAITIFRNFFSKPLAFSYRLANLRGPSDKG
jgi:hypothetical protein